MPAKEFHYSDASPRPASLTSDDHLAVHNNKEVFLLFKELTNIDLSAEKAKQELLRKSNFTY